jgi:uroporphyrinogen decarboxylase
LLAEKLTAAVLAYLKMQAACGVDALQLFDSHGGLLPPTEFDEASGRWIREIISELGLKNSEGRSKGGERERHPNPAMIVFSLGTHDSWSDLVRTGADVLGVDWHCNMAEVRDAVPPTVGLQGNLLPALLEESDPGVVVDATTRLLQSMRGRPGHIVNLGHGVPPTARLENIGALVDTVRGFES